MKKKIILIIVGILLLAVVYYTGREIPYWNYWFASWLIVMALLSILGFIFHKLGKLLENILNSNDDE